MKTLVGPLIYSVGRVLPFFVSGSKCLKHNSGSVSDSKTSIQHGERQDNTRQTFALTALNFWIDGSTQVANLGFSLHTPRIFTGTISIR